MFTLLIYELIENHSKPNESKLLHQSEHLSVDEAREEWEDYIKNNPSEYTIHKYIKYYHIIDNNGKHWELNHE